MDAHAAGPRKRARAVLGPGKGGETFWKGGGASGSDHSRLYRNSESKLREAVKKVFLNVGMCMSFTGFSRQAAYDRIVPSENVLVLVRHQK